MAPRVWIANSHRWLYEKLFEQAVIPDEEMRLVESRREADLIVYLEPPWADPDAPDRLRAFSPRDLLRTFVYSQSDFPIPWAPGAYASLPRSHAGPTCAGASYVAYHHRTPGGLAAALDEAREREPDLLWSFVGTAENAPLRERMLALADERGLARDTKQFSDVVRWNWESTHREEGRQAFDGYADVLGRSKFVLCPRGRGASSIRLFEALRVGRCPVIVSDEWLPPALVDWTSCSLQVPESSVARLPELLREREGEAEPLGREARAVWERFYSPEMQLATLIRTCLLLEPSATPASRAAIVARLPWKPFAARRARWALKSRVSGSARRALLVAKSVGSRRNG
jgi:glycosyltransferase involved in cell wall biosynthesis